MSYENKNLDNFKKTYNTIKKIFQKNYEDKDKNIKETIVNQIYKYYNNRSISRANIFIILGNSGSGKTLLLESICKDLKKKQIEINSHTITPSVKYCDITKMIINDFNDKFLNDEILENKFPYLIDEWYENFLNENNDIEVYCIDHIEMLLSSYNKINSFHHFVNRTIDYARNKYIYSQNLTNFKRVLIFTFPREFNISELRENFSPFGVYELKPFPQEDIENDLMIIQNISISSLSNQLNIFNLLKTYQN